MKRILAVALIFAGAAAFANEQSQSAQKQSSQVEGQSRTSNKENWNQLKKDVGIEGGKASSEQSLRSGKQYEVTGTVAEASKGKVKINRPGMPQAKLRLKDESVITLDGARVEGNALPKGSHIVAFFALKGDEPVATQVRASVHQQPEQGVGGSGQAGVGGSGEQQTKHEQKQMSESQKHEQKQMTESQKHEQRMKEGPHQLQGHTGATPGKDSEDIPTKGKRKAEQQQQMQQQP